MDAVSDVAPTDLFASCPPPGDVLAGVLATYPSALLWDELRQRLPLDAATHAYEAAAEAVRAIRA